MNCLTCQAEFPKSPNGLQKYCAPCTKTRNAQKSKDYRSNPKYIAAQARYAAQRLIDARLLRFRNRPADKLDDYVSEVLGL